MVWVVDATDRLRVEDCREELAGLLLEEVCRFPMTIYIVILRAKSILKRLMGASLLVFLNKTDVEHCMTEEEVREVSHLIMTRHHIGKGILMESETKLL